MLDRRRTNTLLFYALTALAYYLLVRQYIRGIDDYGYPFMINETGYRAPITSWADAIRSQCAAYFIDNGRFLIHVVVHRLTSLTSIVPYCLLSTAMFLLLVEGIGRLARPGGTLTSVERLIALFLTVALNTHPGDTLFSNVAFTLNYMWVGTAIVWFLLLYRRMERRGGPCGLWRGIGLFTAGLVCGSLQESYSLGIAGWLFLVFVRRGRTTSVAIRVLGAGFLLGTAVLVAAPANFSRMENMNDGFVILLSAAKYYGFWAGLLGGSLLYLLNRRLAPDTLRENEVFYVAGGINLLFVSLIACNGARQHCATTIYVTILALHLLLKLHADGIRRHRHAVTAVLLLIMIPVYAGAYSVRERLVRANDAFWRNYVTTGDTLVPATGYYDLLRELHTRGRFNRFTNADYLEMSYYNVAVMNLFASHGQNPHLRHGVLPDEPDSIAALCRPLPPEGIRIFHSDKHDYFVAATRHDNPDAVLTISIAPRAMLYREALRMVKPYKFTEKKYLKYTDLRFTRGDTVYYVLNNVQAEKHISNVKLSNGQP